MASSSRTSSRVAASGVASEDHPAREKGKGVAGRRGKPPKAPAGAKVKPVPCPKVKPPRDPSPSDDDFVDPNGRFPEALFINWKHWEGVGGERGREAHGEVLRRVIKNHVVCVHIG